MIHICLEFTSDTYCKSAPSVFDEYYQKVYKKILSFLYSHPKFPVAFSFAGEQLEYYSEVYPEAIQILKELTSRHQVEVLGGGYYSPIFPLLFPVDRSGQIEKMSFLLRSTVGKRPRGMTLFGSIWDPSLVTTFQSCGMEYVHLDNTLIPSSCKAFYPLITSEQGKTLKVLPVHSNLLPTKDESGEKWILRIKQAVKKETSESELSVFDPVVTISVPIENALDFIKSDCFSYATKIIEENLEPELLFNLPSIYLKTVRHFTPSYIPAGMDWRIAQWAKKMYEKCENKSRFPITIHDFLNTYKQNRRLYERMMYVSMIISQCHGGDKQRKKLAQEKLWESQCAVNYVTLPIGLPAIVEQRQNAYKILNEAERIVRESHDFKESLTSFDYDGDGINEYICQMNKFHAVISNLSGQITELDIIGTSSNYAASLSRVSQFDKVTDSYTRGLFVEHLFEQSEVQNYFAQKPVGNGIFSEIFFEEKKFDGRRREIQIEGKGLFSSINMPVTLRKNYIVSSNGFLVQYILKNESPFPLKGVFVVESNFAQTEFNKENFQYTAELVLKGNKKTVSVNNSYVVENGVSLLQIVDNSDKMSFLFEPNEECGFSSATIPFRRTDENNKVREVSKTFTTRFFWNVDLAVNRAMEKTINLTIMPLKPAPKKK